MTREEIKQLINDGVPAEEIISEAAAEINDIINEIEYNKELSADGAVLEDSRTKFAEAYIEYANALSKVNGRDDYVDIDVIPMFVKALEYFEDIREEDDSFLTIFGKTIFDF